MMKSGILNVLLIALVILAWSCQSPDTRKQSQQGQKETDTQEIENPGQHAAEKTGQTTEQLQKGKEIAKATFLVLSGQLQKAMKEGGVRNAVTYCNFMANPLVDSLSQVYHANIRRTTFHARNPENKPNAEETEMLGTYHSMHKNGEPLKPMLKANADGDTVFYAPIIIPGPLCLTCHGNRGKTMATGDLLYIQSLYPEDEAIGYQVGDLRGMWSITLNAE